MLDSLIPESSFLFDCLWQTSLCMFLGLAGSFVWKHRPARAHRVLLLFMIACLITPVLSYTVRQFGWNVIVREVPANIFNYFSLQAAPIIPSDTGSNISSTDSITKQSTAVGSEKSVPTPQEKTIGSVEKFTVPWKQLLLWGWIVLSGILLIRLLRSLWDGHHLVAQAQPLNDTEIRQIISETAKKLGLKKSPELYISSDVCGALLWPWRRQPALLLSSAILEKYSAKDLRGVLFHELAHLKRRDHWAILLGEVLVCLFPWHPFAWWARARLSSLSEKACDDWVLSGGESHTAYAQLLLNLLPQRHPKLVLATQAGSNHIESRIRHVLYDKHSDPKPGQFWNWALHFQ